MKTIADLGDVRGKRVLVRSDLNVPLDGTTITDPGRIKAALPTITQLANAGARVIVVAHLGRPKGQVVDTYSLAPVAQTMSSLLGQPVALSTGTVDESAKNLVAAMKDGDVVMLENVRFNPEETSKDDAVRASFADKLASLADACVIDGFGVVHRKQASVHEVPQRLPHAAGGLVLAEVKVLQQLTTNPQRPFTVVLGGSKVSDKLGVIDNLLTVADQLIIGGGMAFTFLAAQGFSVGTSLLESDQIDVVKGYLQRAKEQGKEILIPSDVVAATAFAPDAAHDVVPADAIPEDRMGLDIGPQTAQRYADAMRQSRTVFWNGPMGVFEMEAFSAGTKTVAQALTQVSGLSVVGGGDSAAAIRALGFADEQFGHISTGGGASLEYLEGKTLPGLAVLE